MRPTCRATWSRSTPRRAALARHGVQALHCARCDLTLGRARSAQPRHCDTAAAFLDSVLARMPFAVRAIQVAGGSEFNAAFEARVPAPRPGPFRPPAPLAQTHLP